MDEAAEPARTPVEPGAEPAESLQQQPQRRRRLPGWLVRPLRWGRIGLRIIGEALLITWTTPAIYWSNLPWAWARLAVAIAFAGFAVWALWVRRSKRSRWAFAGVFAGALVWWICIPPSQDRPWRPEVAVLPRAQFLDGDNGDRVRLTNFRNF